MKKQYALIGGVTMSLTLFGVFLLTNNLTIITATLASVFGSIVTSLLLMRRVL